MLPTLDARVLPTSHAFQEHLGNPKIDMGPLTKMIALREKLQCKSFK